MQDSECVLNQHCKYLVSTLGSWQKNEKLTGCTRPKQKPTVSRLHCDIHSSAKRKTLTILSLTAVDIDNAIITRLKPTNTIQYVTISYPETCCNIIKQSLNPPTSVGFRQQDKILIQIFKAIFIFWIKNQRPLYAFDHVLLHMTTARDLTLHNDACIFYAFMYYFQ